MRHPFPRPQSYDYTESPSGVSGSWLFCFSSSFELGKFETTVAQLWQEKMQVCGHVVADFVVIVVLLLMSLLL